MTEVRTEAAEIHDLRIEQKRSLEELESLSIENLLQEGRLKALPGEWYEVCCSMDELPPGLFILVTDRGMAPSGLPSLRLADHENALKTLRAL